MTVTISVDCRMVRANAAAVVAMCAARGVEVTGVTKCCCGEPALARAMLSGGITMLGDSRVDSVRRLREAGVDCELWLLRSPAFSEVDDVVRLTQVSLNSEVAVVEALSAAAQQHGTRHGALLMVDTGDHREGVLPEEAVPVAEAIEALPGIDLVGVGTIVGELCGVLPTHENHELIVDVAEEVEKALGRRLRWISGGTSCSLPFVDAGTLPGRINHLRVGDAILIGPEETEETTAYPLPIPHREVFFVAAEVIEVIRKPWLPIGPIGPDANMCIRHWEDRGHRRRAIVALGEQDMRTQHLAPRRLGVEIIGASSDHLVLDVEDAQPPVHVGESLDFVARYCAVASAWPNRLVRRILTEGDAGPGSS
jgi:predicted amino acid racemase